MALRRSIASKVVVLAPRIRQLHVSHVVRANKLCPYDILGVAPDAELKEIKASYYAAAKAFHPDSGQKKDDPEAKHKFAAAKEAFDVLKDAEKRRLYDRWKAAQRGEFDQGPGVVGAMRPPMNPVGRILSFIVAIPAATLLFAVLGMK